MRHAKRSFYLLYLLDTTVFFRILVLLCARANAYLLLGWLCCSGFCCCCCCTPSKFFKSSLKLISFSSFTIKFWPDTRTLCAILFILFARCRCYFIFVDMSALLCNHFFALKQMLQRLTKTNKVENGIFRINNNSHKKQSRAERNGICDGVDVDECA